MGCCRSTAISSSSDTDGSSGSSNGSQRGLVTSGYRSHPLPPLHADLVNDSRENHRHFTPSSSIRAQPIRTTIDESDHLPNKCINVLLLGESGVGKSTFINALVNYLKYDTLEQARAGKPIALMPVSFLLTVGDQFDERIVKFGKADPNEDHHHPGQSVTQYCRSYVFSLNEHTKIRLIDTPGMGDTRGSDQDDRNMQHILSFINNLSHLTAVCILLKPNESRLNVVFRSYFTRLIGFLGEDVRDNIIFCFTNTRATFFAPGNTGPLLKQMLEASAVRDIPFTKANTFCFDNESFRYLIAQRNGINFDDHQTEEYRNSWMPSSKESNRLLKYISRTLQTYPKSAWKSIEHAQFQIKQLVRPVLESIRNILRNIILDKENSSNKLIVLVPRRISCPSTVYHTCKRTPQRYSNFWILPEALEMFADKRTSCHCHRRRSVEIDYRLEYEISNRGNKELIDEMRSTLNQFLQASLKFGCFIHITTHTSAENDPILSYLNQMIEEEKQICQYKGVQSLNYTLLTQLDQFKDDYEQNRRTSMSNRNAPSLVEIYRLIEHINVIGLIREQMNVIQQYHQTYMIKQEKEI